MQPAAALLLSLMAAAAFATLAEAGVTAADRLNLQGRVLKVVTVNEAPFATRDGPNGSFRGFYVDALKLLAKELNFSYTLQESSDGLYGQMEPGGSWNGVMGDVINSKADVALAPLRITANREKYVDFTVSVSSSGMSIVVKRPVALPTTSPALFVKPFAFSTWILVILFYLIYTGLAVAIWLLSPYELGHGSHAETAFLRKVTKAGCSGWMLITGGLLIQGFARTPKAPSARILAFVWWLFTLATVSCYIANLVPIITSLRSTQELDLPFESLEEMVAQPDVPYGVLKGGASFSMLKDSALPSFQRAYKFLTDRPEHLVDNVAEGIARVKRGNYAFLAESLTAEYHTSIDCDLTTAATGITQLDFALAVRKNDELRCILNEAILKLKTTGELTNLKNLWWTSYSGCESLKAARSAALLPGDFVCLYGLAVLGALVAMLALPVEMFLKGTLPKLPSRGRGANSAPSAEAATTGDVPGPSGASAGAAAAASAEASAEPEKKPLV